MQIVDKIVISQDSFGRFVNDVRPGAYASMTHVNFDALDSMDIRPIGLYGSKSEIVRYLHDLAFVDDATYVVQLHRFAYIDRRAQNAWQLSTTSYEQGRGHRCCAKSPSIGLVSHSHHGL